jgi:hypothetical protein
MEERDLPRGRATDIERTTMRSVAPATPAPSCNSSKVAPPRPEWSDSASALIQVGSQSEPTTKPIALTTSRHAISSSTPIRPEPARSSCRFSIDRMFSHCVRIPAKVDSRSDPKWTAIGAKRRSGDPQLKVSTLRSRDLLSCFLFQYRAVWLVAVGAGGLWETAKRFSKACGRVPGAGRGWAAFHRPADLRPGVMGVPGEEGVTFHRSLRISSRRLTMDPCRR